MVDVVHQVLQLRGRTADKLPHLLRKLVMQLHIREVLCQLLANCLETFAKLAQTLPDFLQVHWDKGQLRVHYVEGIYVPR